MMVFEDVEDLCEWLEGLDYEEFWAWIEPYGLFCPESRAEVDADIANGLVSKDDVLWCNKQIARVELIHHLGLRPRLRPPPVEWKSTRVH